MCRPWRDRRVRIALRHERSTRDFITSKLLRGGQISTAYTFVPCSGVANYPGGVKPPVWSEIGRSTRRQAVGAACCWPSAGYGPGHNR